MFMREFLDWVNRSRKTGPKCGQPSAQADPSPLLALAWLWMQWDQLLQSFCCHCWWHHKVMMVAQHAPLTCEATGFFFFFFWYFDIIVKKMNEYSPIILPRWIFRDTPHPLLVDTSLSTDISSQSHRELTTPCVLTHSPIRSHRFCLFLIPPPVL